MSEFKLDAISDAIEDIANGKMVIVVDDEDRENEGDLVMAAQFVTPEAINFMIKHARGLVCLPVTERYLDKWNLQDMVIHNTESMKTAFTVSIDGSKDVGVSTGISAMDRARTIQVFINPESRPTDIVTPGHIFPLRARKMGVLRRAGHTEAAIDLARLAGLNEAGIICEIILENGEMARLPQLIEFAKEHHLKVVTIKELIEYRIQKERFVVSEKAEDIQTEEGRFVLHHFRDKLNDQTHLALVYGNITDKVPLIRVHSSSIIKDVFSPVGDSLRIAVKPALKAIAAHGSGVLIYLNNEIESEELHSKNMRSPLKEYGIGAQILLDLGVKELDLLTNNPKKIVGLEGFGLIINKCVSLAQ